MKSRRIRASDSSAGWAPARGTWTRPAAWASGLSLLAALLVLRAMSGAEYAFAALALLPVVAVAWTSGVLPGLLMALLAAGTWVAGDLASEREFSFHWIPWVNGLVHGAIYAMVATLAGRLRSQLQLNRDRATRDELTGLFNRRHFLELGSVEVNRANRHGRPVAMLFLDLDNFKHLNDRRGHLAGDAALAVVARTLERQIRLTDLVARLGGDEFVVLLPEVDCTAAHRTAQRLAKAVKAALVDHLAIGASVGVACFDAPVPALADMIHAADAQMYRAKTSGAGVASMASAFPS